MAGYLSPNTTGWARVSLNSTETWNLVNWLRSHFGGQVHESEVIISQCHESGIGVKTYVRCQSCTISKDITDYDVW